MNSLRTLSVFLGLGLAATPGCISGDELADDESVVDDDELSETAQSINWSSTFSHHSSEGATKDLGPTSNRTCFLLGLQGSMDSPLDTTRGARIRMLNGRWRSELTPAYTEALQIQGVCIGYTAGRYELWIADPNGPSYSLPATATSQCFLSGLHSKGTYGGWSGNQSNQPNDPPGVKVGKETGGGITRWVFREWLLPESTGFSSGGAYAMCMDIPAVAVIGSQWAVPTGSAVQDGVLKHNPVGENWVCGLTGFFAQLKSGTSTAKIKIHYDAVNRDWRLQMGPNTASHVTCLR